MSSYIGLRTSLEFSAKLDGNRFYIPSKFKEIEIGSLIHYSIVSSDNAPPKGIIKGTVMKKRLVSIPKGYVPDNKNVVVIIFEIFYPIRIEVKKTFQSRVTSRKTIQLPKILGLAPGDFVIGKVMSNITKNQEFHEKASFMQKVTKTGAITLPLKPDQFRPKDRIEYEVDYIIRSAENIEESIPSNIRMDMTFGWSNTEIEIIFSTNLLVDVSNKKIDLKEGENEKIVVDMSETEVAITIYWWHQQKRLAFLFFQVEGEIESLGSFIQSLVYFKKSEIENLPVSMLNPQTLERKYKRLLSTMHTSSQKPAMALPINEFTPADIFDRTKFSTEEATILSILLTRLIEGKPITSIKDLKGYPLNMDDPTLTVNELVTKGFLSKTIVDNEEIGYTIPRFYLKSTMKFLEQQKSLLIIIHSFGGGVAKTTLSVNMGKTFVDMGLRCVVIDFDFVNSRLIPIFEPYLEKSERHYLNDFLNGSAKTEDIIQETSIKSLDVILTSPSSDILGIKSAHRERHAELLEKYIELFSQLKDNYDVIIVDAEGSLDLNILNIFLLADLSIILSNGNSSSLIGLKSRISLILQRIGLGIRNDVLVQTLVPKSKMELARRRLQDWETIFSGYGVSIFPDPIIDEPKVRELIYEDNYFLEKETLFHNWIENFMKKTPRIQKFLEYKKNSKGVGKQKTKG